MAALVADYGSDSQSEGESTTDENEETGTNDTGQAEVTSGLQACLNQEDVCPNYFTSYECDQTPDDSSDRDEDCGHNGNIQDSGSAVKLPKPNFDRKPALTKTASVFANPFRAAEEAKTSVLERHVKMTPTGQHRRSIDGKQVCWNFRKGRCRFGHNCKFAHDSDLAKAHPGSEPSDGSADPKTAAEEGEDGTVEEQPQKKRKKPGLSNTLLPPKRAVKAYRKQQQREQPWLPKR